MSAFYRRLFGRAPDVAMPQFVAFDVAGGLFAIASRAAYAPETRPGGSVRPYIRVGDLERTLAHVRRVAGASVAAEGIVVEGPFSFFRVRDPEGNTVEFFAFQAAQNRE